MTVLHHVQVSCPSGGEAAVRDFYGGLLALTEVAQPPALAKRGGVWFRGDNYELHIGVETPFSPAAKAHPAFLVDDLDSLAARLVASGRSLTWDTDFPGYRRFHLLDPHGNRVELLGEAPADPSR